MGGRISQTSKPWQECKLIDHILMRSFAVASPFYDLPILPTNSHLVHLVIAPIHIPGIKFCKVFLNSLPKKTFLFE